ncbi:FadR family transcriptional regulator [Mucilaginibacter pallidiroseus]|uniref:FadR family transcriptional regulator n=1 Tax=Mucilaginibacter pallidiroseus TaxID=2599295 RepID=A0A563U0Q0_9SPHI|nr:FadR/GntR family transcriptional regulator [Mucilaginibacter pallidiroseus]TWR25123.1 FadR family transcriptional regulator [Mucilaginibacter pallidiroseus]
MKDKLSDKISSQIRADISSGKFKPGQIIPAEPELMKIYNVGRSSIREAIKALAMAGVLSVQQGRGTTVNAHFDVEPIDTRLKRADFDEINAVRQLLEKELVKLAVTNHNATNLQAMQQYLNERKEAIQHENRQACMDADIAFHMAIARAGGNSVLVDLYQSFTLIIRDFFASREPQGISHFAMSHHLHQQLFDAIKSKKEKQAQQVLQQILDNNY